MRMPQKPPPASEIFKEAGEDGVFERLLGLQPEVDHRDRYVHWDLLRRLNPPDGLTHRQWWAGIKWARSLNRKPVPLPDREGKPFWFGVPDVVMRRLHTIDVGTAGHVGVPEPIVNPHTREEYLVRSLIQEAITSSQLEGAATTRDVAKQMLRSGRPPRDRNERMIFNNFRTMERIREWKDKPLSRELVFHLHRMVTEDTLDNPDASGRFRQSGEPVFVQDSVTGEVFHDPPLAGELPERIDRMCAFANEDTPDAFVHPVIRAIILHFWLAYDHPFVDGNGRTARALFYWLMLRRGYWLFEYISISEILLGAPVKYARSFLYTETDDNDLTYFIVYQTEVISRAIQNLHEYLKKKSRELAATEELLRAFSDINHRQQALIRHALRHAGARYSIEEHRRSHGVAYDTARKDLLHLKKLGLLDMRKSGKAFAFRAPRDLEQKLRSLNDNTFS